MKSISYKINEKCSVSVNFPFIVEGSTESGKSTALYVIGSTLLKANPNLNILHIGFFETLDSMIVGYLSALSGQKKRNLHNRNFDRQSVFQRYEKALKRVGFNSKALNLEETISVIKNIEQKPNVLIIDNLNWEAWSKQINDKNREQYSVLVEYCRAYKICLICSIREKENFYRLYSPAFYSCDFDHGFVSVSENFNNESKKILAINAEDNSLFESFSCRQMVEYSIDNWTYFVLSKNSQAFESAIGGVKQKQLAEIIIDPSGKIVKRREN